MARTATADRRSLGTDLGRGVAGAIVAAIVNSGLVLVNDSAGIAPDFRALSLPPVVFLSVIGALAATGVYRYIPARQSSPAGTVTRVTALALVVSFLPDFGLLVVDPAATVPGVALLMVMQVVVATTAVVSLVGNPLKQR